MKIMIGINTLSAVEQPVYSNHIQFFFRLGRHFGDDTTFAINTPRRMSIDRMRNMTAKIALEGEFDYVMFIDDDVIVPIDCLKKLIACDADIAAGHTLIRGYPFQNMFFRYTDDAKQVLQHYPDPVEEGIIPCDAVGFSCALIKCELLKKVAPPFFVTGPYNTEDIYFCIKAARAVPDIKIVVDTSVKTSHNIGSEFIDPQNAAAYRKYYESTFPELAAEHHGDPAKDRGDKYLESIR